METFYITILLEAHSYSLFNNHGMSGIPPINLLNMNQNSAQWQMLELFKDSKWVCEQSKQHTSSLGVYMLP